MVAVNLKNSKSELFLVGFNGETEALPVMGKLHRGALDA